MTSMNISHYQGLVTSAISSSLHLVIQYNMCNFDKLFYLPRNRD